MVLLDTLRILAVFNTEFECSIFITSVIKIEHSNSVLNTAKILNVSSSTIRREVRAGNIPHVKIGKRLLIPGWFLYELLMKPAAIDKD